MSRISIINITIWMAVFLILWFAVLPFYQDIQPLKESVAGLENSVKEEKASLILLESLKEELELREEEINKLNLAIPTQRDVATPVAVFEEASTINGLILISIDVSDLEEERGSKKLLSSVLNALEIRIKMSGTYSSFEKFIEDVEKSFPLLEISQISFRILPAELSGQTGNLLNPSMEFDVVFETYYKAN